MNKLQFLDECRFAKMVITSSGPAILVGGIVLNVSAPESVGFDVVDGVVIALRNSVHTPLPSNVGAAANPMYAGQVGKASN